MGVHVRPNGSASRWQAIDRAIEMNIEKTIVDLESRLREAQLQSNIEELSCLIDDDIVFSGLDGSVLGKEDDLNLHKLAEFQITRMNLISREIRLFENTVVVNVLMDACAVFNGQPQADKIRYIRVWHKFPDGWRIISGNMRTEQA